MEIFLDNYCIYVCSVSEALQKVLSNKPYTQIFVLTDTNCQNYCLPYLSTSVPALKNATVIVTEAGEQHKNIETCNNIWRQLLAARADRGALLINLGGGVVGDMGGFVAATYKRRIDFVQIPTTLLAQVDASVGGKVGIDFEGVKNAIGAFCNPRAVCIDTYFLQTMPFRQWKNGLAEMLKHALIADAEHWRDLCNALCNNSLTALAGEQAMPISTHLIAHSVQLKKNVVEQDPYEKGVRKILNFGHTIGHAIESLSLQYDLNPLLHGEAIGLGMMAEILLSVQYADLAPDIADEVIGILKTLYPPTYKIAGRHKNDFWTYLYNDKKNKNGQLKFSLLSNIGAAIYDCEVSKEDIEKNLYTIGLF